MLRKKIKDQGGFTLVEMLIVVAIIAILIAVSIPMVSGSLDKAQKATDAANVRAAKAVATVEYLNGELGKDKDNKIIVKKYDANKGTLAAADETVAGYGQASDKSKQVIYVKVEDGVVHYAWSTNNDAPADAGWETDTPIVEDTP